MKFEITFLLSICFASFFAGCKEKAFDSPYITILAPVQNQAVQDKDNILIKAEIKPSNSSVINSHIIVMDTKGNVLASSNLGCACKGLSVVNIDHSILYLVEKKQDVMLEICANLENGQSICERIPFVITN